jgi:two-component system NarL family response regulator
MSKRSTDKRPVTLLLADDHEVILQGVATLLGGDRRFKVVGMARTGQEAIRLHDELNPDVTLLDIRMPELDGIGALASIRKASPRARVIMFAAEDYPADMLHAWELGAAGFLLKTGTREELIGAIESAHTLGWCHPFKPGYLPVGASGNGMISARELEVLDYVRRGLSNADIATALTITEHTVKAHLKMIFLKLGCADRTEAVIAALERGLLRLSPNHVESNSHRQSK